MQALQVYLVLQALAEQAKSPMVLSILLAYTGVFFCSFAQASPISAADTLAVDRSSGESTDVLSGSPALNLQQLQQQIESLRRENVDIKRQQQVMAEKIKKELAHSAMTQDLVQDLDAQYHQALKISGYADVEANFEKDANYFRLHHFSLFFKKSIGENWHLFSEIEYEDAPLIEAKNEKIVVNTPSATAEVTQVEHASGAIFLEAMNLDYHWKAGPSLRLGRFFTPAGIWSIDHYPPFVVTQVRPLHIRKIFPQLVDGLDFYGSIGFGRHWFRYDVYLGNGENNDMQMKDRDGNKSIGIRAALDMDWLMRTEIGVSAYHDTHLTSPCRQVSVSKRAAGVHYKLQWHRLTAQSEYAVADYKELNSTSTCRAQGAYTQLAWKLGKSSFGLRSDQFDDKIEAEKNQRSLFFNYRIQKDVLLKWESHWLTQSTRRVRWSIATVAVNLGH